MKYIIAILFLLVTGSAFAQQGEKPLVQFTGIVRNADSLNNIVPYVNITNKATNKQVATANYAGYFSFPVHEQDTLTFTSIGFKSVTVVIPANVPSKSYLIKVDLKPAIINLPVFHVFPWATVEEFKHDFLTMKIADDDLEIARKNLSASSIYMLERTLPQSGEYLNAQQMHNDVVNSHSLTNPLLNPFAWGSLIKDIAAGDKSRSN